MSEVKEVAVYGASSSRIDRRFLDAAFTLGAMLAKRGAGVVCGGGNGGMMRAVTDGALSEGGRVTEVLPEFMMEKQWNHHGLTETIVTDTMHTRKATMLSRAGAVVALPGGIGTFDELFEAMTWRQLGLWSGQLVILNTDGFYDPLLQMLDECAAKGFLRENARTEYAVATTPAEAVEMIFNDNI